MRAAQTHQADQIRTVGVVVEGDQTDLVAAHLRIVVALTLIRDVAHHVAVLVLRPRIAEVRSDPPIQHRQIVVIVPVDRERAQTHEAAAVDQLALHTCELLGERTERELVAPDVPQIVGDGFRGSERSVELTQIGRVELDRPRRRIGDVVRPPIDVRLQLFRLEGDHACTIPCGPRTRLPGSAPVDSPSR